MSDTIEFPDFMKIDLRIGTVEVAERIEKSDKLVRLEINFGEEIGRRQILAGIAEKYELDELKDRQIVAIVNLAPRKMMGLESQGMLLAGGDEEVALLKPDKEMPNGTKVR